MVELNWPRRSTFVDDDAGDEGARLELVGPDVTVDVDDEDTDRIERYLDRGFEKVEDEDQTADTRVLDTPDQGDQADDAADDQQADQSDEGDTDDQMDWDTYTGLDYQDRADAVASGDVDHLLDRIDDDDESSTVQNAVEARKAETEA